MNSNRNATLHDLFDALKKNNQRIKDNYASKISTKLNNAIKVETDGGIFSEDLTNRVNSLDNRSIIGKELMYGYLSMSANQTIATADVSINFDIMKENNGITLESPGHISLPMGTYKLSVMIGDGTNGTFGTYGFYNESEAKYFGEILDTVPATFNSSYNSGTVLNGLIKVTNNSTIISIKKQGTGNSRVIEANRSNLIITEVSRQWIVDPLSNTESHTTQEVLFESATIVTTGNITLSKDCTEFDELVMQYKADGGGLTTSSVKTSELLNTITSGTLLSVVGYSDYYMNYKAIDNKTIQIAAYKSYGFVKIIGKKSMDPVVYSYIPNIASFESAILFEGTALSSDTTTVYTLTESVKNFDYLVVSLSFTDGKGAKSDNTILVSNIKIIDGETFGLIAHDVSGTYTACCARIMFPSETTFKMQYALSSMVQIYKITGYKATPSSDVSKTQAELTECINTIWEEGV